jgi:DNA-binding NtrC family response regulator
MTTQIENKGSIIVIDDKKTILQILKFGFSENGYEVVTALNATEALHHIQERSFDFAIVDIHLPEMNGIALSDKIREASPDTLIVIMTGYPEIDSAVEALRHHAYDYLIKPFKFEQIYSIIERARGEIALRKENRDQIEQIRQLREENSKLRSLLQEIMPEEFRVESKLVDKKMLTQARSQNAIGSYQKVRDELIQPDNKDSE